MRKRFRDLLEPEIGSGVSAGQGWRWSGAFVVETALVLVIAVNSASLILLWTVPELRADHDFWFHVVEHITVGVFLVEYALRLWVARKATLGHPGGVSGGITSVRPLR